MNKEEAIAAMQQGNKVRHRFFANGEWMVLNERGNYQFEDGVEITELDFWINRPNNEWQEDWELFEE